MKGYLPAIFSICSFLLLYSCTPEKKPIKYGQDNCHYCNMTIVDKRYGSEMVSTKGKVYKFDAVECLINFLQEGEVAKGDVAMKLVNTYDQPGQLVNATESHYLRSEELPSPMGYYITPFTTNKAADSVKQHKSGKIYDWEALNKQFDNFSRNMENS